MSRLKGTLILVALVALGMFAGIFIRRQIAPPPIEPNATTKRPPPPTSAEQSASGTPPAATTAPRQVNPKASLLVRIRCDGKPLPGAAFSLMEEASHHREQFKTGQDGAHAVLGLPAGEYHISVELPDYVPAAAHRRIQADRGHEVVIELHRGSRLEGKVTDVTGRPLEGTNVLLVDEKGLPKGETKTDASGEYRIARIPVGSYSASFRKTGYRAGAREPLNVTGPGMEFRIDKALVGGRTITGKVVTEDGTPIPGATVIGENEEISTGRTDEKGAFALDSLGDGLVSAFASAVGYGAVYLKNLEPGSSNVEFRMAKAGEVQGRIHAQPVPKQYTVRVSRYEAEFGKYIPTYTKSFEAGNDFRVSELTPGRYRVEASAPGFEAQDVPELEISAGQSVTGIQIRMRKIS